MMAGYLLSKLVIVLILCTITSCRLERGKKAFAELYYSALDSKSAQFLKEKLKDITLFAMLKYVNVFLFPFAGCSRNKTAAKIVCRLGTEEVRANFYHLCAFYELHKPKSPTGVLSFSFNAIMYALCTTDTLAKGSIIGKVVKKLDLLKCAKHIKGMEEKVEKCVYKEDDNLVNDIFKKYELSHIVSYPVIISNHTFGKFFGIKKKSSVWEEFCKSQGQNAPSECDQSDDKHDGDKEKSDKEKQSSDTPSSTIGYYGASSYGVIIPLVVLMLQ